MIRRTLEQINSMINDAEMHTCTQPIHIAGVSTDTRTIQAGNLFIPLMGEHYDGHQYVQAAFDQGAAAALWQRDHVQIPSGIPVILVDDTLLALQQLAANYRKQLSVRVIGITGSNGKTSTKDMVASVMASQYRVHKTKGNLNNHIGLPQTLLQMDEETEIAVLEMGMSGRGEIELLSNMASPDAVIITNIGEAHLQQLGSREEIARAKFEIISGLSDGGALIYHGDEPLLHKLIDDTDRKNIHIIRFGSEVENNYYPNEISIHPNKTVFSVHVRRNSHTMPALVIPLLGRHNVINALAAIAVAEFFGLDESSIRTGLQQMTPTGMRIELIRARNGLTILNDAYNASPASMRAAIELLEELQGFRQKIVVLGDMLELGPQSENFHRGIGKILKPRNIDYVFTFGDLAAYIAEECQALYSPNHVLSTTDKSELMRMVSSVAHPQDVVLVKASRGKRLEDLVEVLREI
jgi:UDP-N-acetylmuramoyl-tripeptide--D-alanyl-D-alanine ligase